MRIRLFLLILLVLFIVACGANGETGTDTAVSQATTEPDPTQPATVAPTATTSPTDTPTPLPATPTNAPPTETPEPETFTYWAYHGGLPAGAWDEQNALAYVDAQPNMVYSPNAKNEMTGDPIAKEIDHTHYEDEDIDRLWDKTQELLELNVGDYL